MNFWYWLIALLFGSRFLKRRRTSAGTRRCQACGHEQFVSPRHQGETMPCVYCGADLPPMDSADQLT